MTMSAEDGLEGLTWICNIQRSDELSMEEVLRRGFVVAIARTDPPLSSEQWAAHPCPLVGVYKEIPSPLVRQVREWEEERRKARKFWRQANETSPPDAELLILCAENWLNAPDYLKAAKVLRFASRRCELTADQVEQMKRTWEATSHTLDERYRYMPVGELIERGERWRAMRPDPSQMNLF